MAQTDSKIEKATQIEADATLINKKSRFTYCIIWMTRLLKDF